MFVSVRLSLPLSNNCIMLNSFYCQVLLFFIFSASYFHALILHSSFFKLFSYFFVSVCPSVSHFTSCHSPILPLQTVSLSISVPFYLFLSSLPFYSPILPLLTVSFLFLFSLSSLKYYSLILPLFFFPHLSFSHHSHITLQFFLFKLFSSLFLCLFTSLSSLPYYFSIHPLQTVSLFHVPQSLSVSLSLIAPIGANFNNSPTNHQDCDTLPL